MVLFKGPHPSVPLNVKATVSEYSIIIQWLPPNDSNQYLRGYRLHYTSRFFNGTVMVDPRLQLYVLDMTPYPGVLLDIWIESVGDVGNSEAVKLEGIRSRKYLYTFFLAHF